MHFHLSAEQELFQDYIRRAIDDACSPARRRSIIEAQSGFDPKVWSALMELGLGGVLTGQEQGTEDGLLLASLAMEMIGEGAAPGPFLSHLLATLALVNSEEPTAGDWVDSVSTGEVVATVAFAGGWSPSSWSGDCTDGRITAFCDHVEGADVAGIFIVGLAGGRLALVERSNQVFISSKNNADCTRRLSTVEFRGAKGTLLSDDRLDADRVHDACSLLVAADALGGASACLGMTVDYAKTRRQFDRPIAEFQAIKHQLADMAIELEPARALVWYAAYSQDNNLPDAPRAAAMAKAHLAERFVSIARNAVLIHGGIGYTWEYDLQIWFRRSLFDYAFCATPAVHRERAAVLAGW